jgi:enediyne biosynthesis protein E4
VQVLLPHAFSSEGPAMATADINDDGLQDLYLGGAKGQLGKLFIQNKRGSYTVKKEESFEINAESEKTDAVFFDMDNDGDQDLYVVSGGYEFNANDTSLQDHLYKNDGNGNFVNIKLPSFTTSGSCVRPADLDNDGDLDLFIGGRVVPGRFPETPPSVILQNDGQGHFEKVTNTIAPGLEYAGMVTDAAWVDLNDDKFLDLILVGEWMPITVFLNEAGKLMSRSSDFFKDKTEGWWNCILAVDVDKDGRKDLVAGNYGLNNQFKPSESRPMTMYYSDIDDNGSLDPIINYFIGDKSYPLPTRDELTDQVPSFKKRFPDYASYATASINSVLSSEELRKSVVLTTYRFETTYFHNEGDHFEIRPLPYQAQVAPVMDIQSGDINSDGNTDLIMGGNISKMGARFGKAAGSFTTVLLGDGKSGFTNLSSLQSGLCVRADIRKMLWIKDRLIIAPNNDAVLVYELSK